MKAIFQGFLLALQFFTIVPVNKELPMTKNTTTAMYACLPVIGLLLGSCISVTYYLLENTTSFSPLFNAAVILIMGIVLSGGLHMDGWLDTSDAYFSYYDKAKRLEILDDPRTGAFGVISFVVLILAKLVIIYEVLLKEQSVVWLVVLLPFLSRVAMIIYFVAVQPAKEKGIVAYFKSIVQSTPLKIVIILYLVATSIGACILGAWIIIIQIVVMLTFIWIYRRWSIKHFGGISGDLIGALCEGMEVLLWLILLLCI